MTMQFHNPRISDRGDEILRIRMEGADAGDYKAASAELKEKHEADRTAFESRFITIVIQKDAAFTEDKIQSVIEMFGRFAAAAFNSVNFKGGAYEQLKDPDGAFLKKIEDGKAPARTRKISYTSCESNGKCLPDSQTATNEERPKPLPPGKTGNLAVLVQKDR